MTPLIEFKRRFLRNSEFLRHLCLQALALCADASVDSELAILKRQTTTLQAEHPGEQNWQGQRHFVFYDEMSHIGGIQLPYSIDDAENFIRTKLLGGRRN